MTAGTYARFDLRILYCSACRLEHWQYDNLAAPYWRLYWNAEPGAEVISGGETVPLVPERMMLIPPETSYAARLRAPVLHLYLHFLLRPPHDSARKTPFAFDVPPAMRERIDQIIAALREPQLPWRRLSLLAAALIHEALCRFPEERWLPAFADERVAAAVRTMRAAPERKLSNGELARAAGMNVNAFIRLFREVAGEAPQSYFTRLRVEQACILLHYSDRSIAAVAEETGFCDRYHFSRVFKALRGMGPAQFRRTLTPARQIAVHAHAGGAAENNR